MNFALRKTFLRFAASRECRRHYPRWGSERRPLGVIQPEEYDESKDTRKMDFKEEVKINWRYKTERALQETSDEEALNVTERPHFVKKVKNPRPVKAIKTTDMLETVIDADGNFVYTKMANNDPRVGILLATVKAKKEKTKRNLILLEGKRLIKDALDAGCKLRYLVFSRKDELEFFKGSLPKIGVQLFKMPYREMEMWSNLTTPPGIMGIFKTPEVDKYEPKQSIPLTIVCDNIREPGNLGSILRAAAGVGCKKLILTKGCVSLWDSKVTRTACGSHFHIQIHEKKTLADVRADLSVKSRCFLADNNSITNDAKNTRSELNHLIASIPVVPYYSVVCQKDDDIVLIVGGETEGISSEAYKLAGEYNGVRLNIPLCNGVESLNAGTALGIISFEIRKQLSITNSNYVDKLAETDVSLGLRNL